MKSLAEVLLWLFVINLGIAFGAGLYEKRIVLPLWFSKSVSTGWQVNTGAMRQTNTGLRFWAYATTVPLKLLAIPNLAMALLSNGARHDWWLVAATLSLVARVGTFAFFIPTAIRLMNAESLPGSRISPIASMNVDRQAPSGGMTADGR
jgi:hypothetical protein